MGNKTDKQRQRHKHTGKRITFALAATKTTSLLFLTSLSSTLQTTGQSRMRSFQSTFFFHHYLFFFLSPLGWIRLRDTCYKRMEPRRRPNAPLSGICFGPPPRRTHSSTPITFPIAHPSPRFSTPTRPFAQAASREGSAPHTQRSFLAPRIQALKRNSRKKLSKEQFRQKTTQTKRITL